MKAFEQRKTRRRVRQVGQVGVILGGGTCFASASLLTLHIAIRTFHIPVSDAFWFQLFTGGLLVMGAGLLAHQSTTDR